MWVPSRISVSVTPGTASPVGCVASVVVPGVSSVLSFSSPQPRAISAAVAAKTPSSRRNRRLDLRTVLASFRGCFLWLTIVTCAGAGRQRSLPFAGVDGFTQAFAADDLAGRRFETDRIARRYP